MSGKLTWSHWYEMLSIKDINKIKYYVNQCEINNNNTIGILICKKENKFVIKYCSDDRIIVRKYQVV